MPNNEMDNDLRARWQSQPGDDGKMPIGDIRVEAQSFQDRIRRRNTREYFASSVTILIFVLEILFIPFPLPVRVALLLWIAAIVNFIFQIRKRGSSRALPADLGSSCLDFHRRELERQRDALASFWLWGVVPCLPGGAVLAIAISFARPGAWIMSLIFTALFVAFLGFFAQLNLRAARRLQRKIEDP